MKVLVWNIEKFTDAKFREGSTVRPGWERKRIRLLPAPVLNYMRQVFNGNGDAEWRPHVIAILEVMAPTSDALGAPLRDGSSGAVGLIELLGCLWAWTDNPAWRLVPPLKCNPARPLDGPWSQSEVVGVFYDNTAVQFDGPNEWIAGASQPVGTGPAEPYPPPWNTAAVTLETTKAGIVDFYLPSGRQLTFPGAGNRRPFVVDFTERGGAQRTMRFGFVHTSPGFHIEGTREFAHVQQMRQNGEDDPAISIYAGDFNVDDYQVASRRRAFRPLQNQRFWKAFTKTAQRSTHYRMHHDATPNNWDTYQGDQLIDNFLVRHKDDAGSANTRAYPKAAVNCVEGWPAPYTTSMNATLPNIVILQNAVATFREWLNFWHIRRCSDHVPTFMNIT